MGFKFSKSWFIFYALLVTILIILAFVTGLYVKNWPLFTLDKKIKVSEVLGYGITFLITLGIPFYIEFVIARSKKIGNTVINEIERYRKELGVLQNRFLFFYQNGQITENNKTEILTLTEVLDSKYSTLEKIIEKVHNQKATIILSDFKEKHILYWSVITNSNVLSITVNSIDRGVFENGVRSYQELDESLINVIIRLA
jgi:hypothetical protein